MLMVVFPPTAPDHYQQHIAIDDTSWARISLLSGTGDSPRTSFEPLNPAPHFLDTICERGVASVAVAVIGSAT
jgi:hypothetical protein